MIQVNDIINGTISGIKPYGVFIKFNDTFGFCHISNCSFKFIKNLNDLFQINQAIEAKVIEIDSETNKINLSIKACENKPTEEIIKPIIDKPKREFKSKPATYFNKPKVEEPQTFEDMLKSYLKNSDERLDSIGKRNQKHRKR